MSSTSVSAPDTPLTRRFAALNRAQQSRRVSTQHILFSSSKPSPSASGLYAAVRTNLSPDGKSYAAVADPDSTSTPPPQIHSEIVDPTATDIIIEPDMPADELSSFNTFIIDNMLTGSSLGRTHSSFEVFSTVMANAAVPKTIAEMKSVRVTGVPAFVSLLKSNQKLSIHSSMSSLDNLGYVLRSNLRSITTYVQNEYNALEFPVFLAQVCLQFLSQSSHAETLMAQFHRYLHLRDEADIVAFEDRCALGLPAEIQIDFTISASELPGYKRLVQDSAEWIRVITALIDYVGFMTNSQLQTAYTESKRALVTVRLNDFDAVQKFDDAELRLYNIFDSYAVASNRSSIDNLDRGLQLLKNLPTTLRKDLDTWARKYGIPENCMNRDWVFQQLARIEKRDAADFCFWSKSKPPPVDTAQD